MVNKARFHGTGRNPNIFIEMVRIIALVNRFEHSIDLLGHVGQMTVRKQVGFTCVLFHKWKQLRSRILVCATYIDISSI